MRSDTKTIISALRVLARDIQTDDGVVNACLDEAASRMEELDKPWIKVGLSDGSKPESGKGVLVAGTERGIPIVVCAFYTRGDDCDAYGGGMLKRGRLSGRVVVTHWMPLPNPPTK